MQYTKTIARKAGFTLIELSIVLVIIGLIVGGVLVGQDLIKAAEIRALISQIEKYNSAVNTFRGKYNAMPGDITCSATGQAAQFGLFAETTACGVGHGDGNGLIEGGAANAALPAGEVLTFWRHLSEANIVDGNYGQVGNSAIVVTTGVVTGTVTNISQSVPVAKLGPAGYITVYASSGLNYYQVIPMATITTAAFTNGTSGMTPVQAYNIDAKLDDGAPSTGIVKARGILAAGLDAGVGTGDTGLDPTFAATSTDPDCVVGATATAQDATYNRVATSGGNSPSCSLRLRFN